MNSPYHQAWRVAGNKAIMREFRDIRAYLSDSVWIWPCGAMVDEKEDDPRQDWHNTSKCDVCTKAIKEVVGE